MNTGKLNAAGWIRLVIYIASALVGLAAVIVTALGYTDIAQLLGVVAGAGAAITGGTAVVNLPKAPDQNGLNLAKVVPALTQIAEAAAVFHAAQMQPATGRHAATAPAEPDMGGSVGLSIYTGPTSD